MNLASGYGIKMLAIVSFCVILSVASGDPLCAPNNGCYPCHCKTGQCDGSSGNCVQNECKKGYLSVSGKSNCQIVDIAYNKPTLSSSQYLDWDDDHVVDGEPINRGVYGASQCFHGNRGDTEHWWQVNFESKKFVKWMKMTPRWDCCQHRMSNFKVYVSNVTAVKDDPAWKQTAQLCHTHGQISQHDKEPINIECDNTLYGQYLIVIVEDSTEPINFCKLVVFQCADYLYGENCLNNCQCVDASEVCHTITGVCQSTNESVEVIGPTCDKMPRELSIILEKLTDLETKTNLLEERVACPYGWHKYGSSCYTTTQCGNWTVCKWDYHKNFCISMGGYLTSISSEGENDFVASVVARAFSSMEGDSSVYIGARRADESSSWLWQDGSALTYTNWDDEASNPGETHCAILKLGSMGKWWSVPCSRYWYGYGSVCKLDL